MRRLKKRITQNQKPPGLLQIQEVFCYIPSNQYFILINSFIVTNLHAPLIVRFYEDPIHSNSVPQHDVRIRPEPHCQPRN